MKSEELKNKIIIQKYTNLINENGFEIEEWQDIKTVWAKVENLYGKEYFEAAAIQAEKTIKFTIRFIEDINENMRIKFTNKYYSITYIDNIKYKNKFIEIKAMEVDISG